jgi:hypothetical protein
MDGLNLDIGMEPAARHPAMGFVCKIVGSLRFIIHIHHITILYLIKPLISLVTIDVSLHAVIRTVWDSISSIECLIIRHTC